VAGEDSLTNREFIGTILPTKDTAHQGKYKVNVPELQPHMKETTGIWCKNHTCRHRVSPSQVGVSGSYYPLQAGMSVIVKFFANHIESAYIDRVISDAYSETLPYEIIERDEYYQIIRTPRHNNLICIYESDTASKNVPKNSIHVYFNDTRTTVVIDETGINIKTDDNINVTVAKNVKIVVAGTADIKVTGNTNIETSADMNLKAAGKVNIQSGGDANVKAGGNANIEASGNVNMKGSVVSIEASGVMNLKAGGAINMQGSVISQNGTAAAAGAAGDAASAALADAPSLITLTDYEYFTKSSGK
jgi:hypothetical protein